MEDNEEQQEAARTIPYERFQKVVSERDSWRSKHESAQEEMQTLTERSATVDTLGRELELARTKIATLESDGDLNMQLAERGFDSEGRSVVRMLHDKLPEEDRPNTVDWVDSMKDDASKRPKSLFGYFDTVKADVPEKVETPKKTLPRSDRHSSGNSSGAGDVTAAQIKAAREKAIATGQWGPVRELLASLEA